MSSQLQVISIRGCPNIDAMFLTILHENANPFTLRELHLDACEAINDDALAVFGKQLTETQVEVQERHNISSLRLAVDILKCRQRPVGDRIRELVTSGPVRD